MQFSCIYYIVQIMTVIFEYLTCIFEDNNVKIYSVTLLEHLIKHKCMLVYHSYYRAYIYIYIL